VTGATQVKRRDYRDGDEVEAANEYAAWKALKGTGRELRVGDVLEGPDGALRICKYVGFDAAEWVLPEVKTDVESAPAASPGTA